MAKILLVEDDDLLIRMYQRKLKADGFTLETATNGADGVEKAKSFHPDLIMTDIMMPKMNGLEELQLLKQDKDLKNIPVILLTNMGDGDKDVESGMAMGAVAYLVKSEIGPDEVVAKVKEILAAHV